MNLRPPKEYPPSLTAAARRVPYTFTLKEKIAYMFLAQHRPIYPLPTLLMCILAATLSLTSRAADDGPIVWIDNYAKALAETRATGKPMLLAFRCIP